MDNIGPKLECLQSCLNWFQLNIRIEATLHILDIQDKNELQTEEQPPIVKMDSIRIKKESLFANRIANERPHIFIDEFRQVFIC